LAALGGADAQELSADQFLELLRRRAAELSSPASGVAAEELAEAILRALGTEAS